MEYQEFVKQRRRMCDSYNSCNSECPIYLANNKSVGFFVCSEFCTVHPKQAEEIVAKWASEHPVMTNRQKAEEIFGVEFTKGCASIACPKSQKDVEPSFKCKNCEYKGFWDQEYKEKES